MVVRAAVVGWSCVLRCHPTLSFSVSLSLSRFFSLSRCIPLFLALYRSLLFFFGFLCFLLFLIDTSHLPRVEPFNQLPFSRASLSVFPIF